MSIREQVDDARFLAQNGRHVGALTNLMLAVAASARKCFPNGTKSQKTPRELMGDGEAFTLFLGGRIRKILLGNHGGSEFGSSGISIKFKGRQYDVEYVLYKFYRCELVHEGELPEDVEFIPGNRPACSVADGTSAVVSVSISAGDKMVLDHGWIDLLIGAVVNARCNGKEFGIQHFDLLPKLDGDAIALEGTIVERYDITLGRLLILKHAVRLISPSTIEDSDDRQLSSRFLDLISSGKINGGAIIGLSTCGLTDGSGQLQAKGISALREIASAYELVRLS